MAKYTPEAREFIAQCYQDGVPYERACVLVQERFGVHMPQGTYDYQKSYLKHRSPSEMGQLGVTSIGELARTARRSPQPEQGAVDDDGFMALIDEYLAGGSTTR